MQGMYTCQVCLESVQLIIFTERVDVATGSAFMFGLGYEFKQHWMIEGTYLVSGYDDGDVSSPQLTLNYMWY